MKYNKLIVAAIQNQSDRLWDRQLKHNRKKET